MGILPPERLPKILGKDQAYSLHHALRTAILEDAQAQGLDDHLLGYRRRALAYYMCHCPSDEPMDPGWSLDVLFLHRAPRIQALFFGQSSVPLSTEAARFAELESSLEPLMRQNPWFQMIEFAGPVLDRFIDQTREWLALDYALHGETLRYFHTIRREGQLIGFGLNVPVTEETLPLLRRDLLGQIYQSAIGPLQVDARCFYSLRLVTNELEGLSVILRAIFAQMSSQVFERLIVVIPWAMLMNTLGQMGFEVLSRDIAHEGQTYAIGQLDVRQHAARGIGCWAWCARTWDCRWRPIGLNSRLC